MTNRQKLDRARAAIRRAYEDLWNSHRRRDDRAGPLYAREVAALEEMAQQLEMLCAIEGMGDL